MNMNYINRLSIICSLGLIFSCSGEKDNSETPTSPRIKNFSKLSAPSSNQEIVMGEPVNFEITSSQQVDSILLSFETEQKVFTETQFTWTPIRIKTGRQKVKISVYSGEDSETHYARLIVLSDVSPTTMTYEVIGEYPHDEEAFIQGLFFLGDTLVESTGQEGTSRISKINLQSGEVYKTTSLADNYFGEGSTVWKDQIYYLTWQDNIGFIYNLNLEETGQFNYTYEGWGMTTMGDTLIISDGKEVLHLLDPRDMSEISRLEVYDHEGLVNKLNELEYFNGKIYANIWQQEIIISIDPATGKVLEIIDFNGLRDNFDSNVAEVLNGIAYKQNTDQIFVTGKNWPKLFEVKFKLNN
ncbi:glutaminyl-peptide cyclotransferase [Marinoscillum sp.]|uniref:glutaminyl-peptide cyclotransferase n=1 Tax=Marinoscillum sp. TaxID=2024838 RepID=UPI003BAB3064